MRQAGSLHLRVLPATRGECIDEPRPCPYVSCRFHLLLNVTSNGRLYRTRDFDEDSAESLLEALAAMPETCALDVADRGAHTFEQISEFLGVDTKEVFRHYEIAADKMAVLVAGDYPDDPYFRIMAEQELRNPKNSGGD